eukprot:TRINITY_DN18243_c0_g1_i1.p1 TRINITY_DN18243_c0_g1~~TRINITY_DN18243_c0_g1_i1.p1  ORF type:complete len:461 (-),score=86.19 TRINITY_DN18243_c0_g1_i1:148-1530(-)
MAKSGKAFACLLAIASGKMLGTADAAIDACAFDDSCSPTHDTYGMHFSLLQYQVGFLSEKEIIQQARLQLEAAPRDLAVQLEVCTAMQGLADTQREGPGPFGGRRVSTVLLSAGIGEPMAQGLLNAVAIETAQGHTSPGVVSQMCLGAISALQVQNDFFKGLALITNAPSLWQSVVAYFKAYKHTTPANSGLCMFAGLFGTPQPRQAAEGMVAAGAIEFIIDDYLSNESLKTDPEMFQRVYCALSDPVHESSGAVARAIANHGGALQGIPLMVRTLQWAKDSGSTFHEMNGFGLLYEGVHDVGGILEHDDANHTFAKSFVEAGLVQQLIPIMQKDPGDRMLQDMSCEVIKWITDDSVTTQRMLVEEGVLEIVAAALKQHSHPPYKGYGAVTIACSTALLNFANNATWLDRMRQLGVYSTLNEEVFAMFPPSGSDDFVMRRQWFPNSNIYMLKEVLQPHEQ